MTLKLMRINRAALNTRSSGDSRRRVDAYFVSYWCPPDDVNPEGWHEWVCRFEVPVKHKFTPIEYASKAQASANRGYVI